MNEQNKILVTKIRSQYEERQITKLDKLKEFNRKVKEPAKVFSYIFGTIGALILGTGMSLAMKVIGDIMIPGIIIGLVGIVIVSINYSIYKAILKSRRKKYAQEIFNLSDELLNN